MYYRRRTYWKIYLTLKKYIFGIQHQLSILIPEKWNSIYLYASVIKTINISETWEMYFYYYPSGLLKRKAINVYEIPNKFNLDEKKYLELVDNLCNTIKILYKEYKKTYDKTWSNIVISIKNSQFLIEYSDDNLIKSKYSSEARHILFKYKYLNMSLQNFNKNEIKIIQEYLENEDYCHVYDSHFEYMQQQKVNNYIEYEKDFELEDTYCNQLVVTNEKKFSFWRFIIELITRRKHPKSKDKLVEPKQIEQIY